VTPVVLVMFCLAGAAAGFLRTRPVYRSEAVVWHDRADGRGMEALGAFPVVALSAPVSREVVARAMRGPRWERSWPTGRAAETSFLSRLSSRGAPEGIRVSYEDSDRRLARERLGAFVEADVQAVREKLDAWRAARLKPVEERRAAVEAELVEVERTARAAAVEARTSIERAEAYWAVVRLLEGLRGRPGAGPEGVARGVVETVTWPLVEVVYGPDRPQGAAPQAQFRLEGAKQRRVLLLGELGGLQSRRADINAAASIGATVVSGPSAATTVLDDRWRDAAWGAGVPLGVFVVIRLPRWGRAALVRWRTTRVKGAFEVVVRPRRVVPVEE
jgi:hypothetical protein